MILCKRHFHKFKSFTTVLEQNVPYLYVALKETANVKQLATATAVSNLKRK